MRLIHAAGFSAAERESFRIVVFSNVMQSMQTILEAMEYLRIPLSESANMSTDSPFRMPHSYLHFFVIQPYIVLFSEYPTITKGKPYPDSYLRPLRSLWQDGGVQEAFRRGNTFALNDNVKYFFDQLDRLFAADYVPIDQDIIRCRVKTTGIVETVFHLGPLTYRSTLYNDQHAEPTLLCDVIRYLTTNTVIRYNHHRMFDVGGQRSERKKWIHCFENVTALLFVVAISGYDQCLVEDKDALISFFLADCQNQMHEALMLFDSICNSQWFINTSMILFLNKIDIFKIKITTSPVSKYFSDYKEGPDDDFNQTKAYFRRRFIRLNRSEKKEVYPHFTDATDTNLLRHVMTADSDIILNENLQLLLL
ncbi:hypothetical protein BC937DRAFT_91667 [Endogone sp. FLAS-F59071]|nr:hypothetical protein BC937DRAFT_91667 [Endogone sp. FLAS-F59071]|eukprot:RUS16043.1 hypothetical protein BC937DRAFT_91667 [Endogone sp. FLAS-F59071]